MWTEILWSIYMAAMVILVIYVLYNLIRDVYKS